MTASRSGDPVSNLATLSAAAMSVAPLPDETLAAMKIGKRFAISFQNVSKENIVIPFGLSNFAEEYQHIQ